MIFFGSIVLELYVVLPIAFFAFVVVVGGYVYMFLHVMRSDPRELHFREKLGQDSKLVPRSNKPKEK
jgi:hypothetical protein